MEFQAEELAMFGLKGGQITKFTFSYIQQSHIVRVLLEQSIEVPEMNGSLLTLLVQDQKVIVACADCTEAFVKIYDTNLQLKKSFTL